MGAVPEQDNITNETIQSCFMPGVDLNYCHLVFIWESMLIIENVYKMRTEEKAKRKEKSQNYERERNPGVRFRKRKD